MRLDAPPLWIMGIWYFSAIAAVAIT